MNPNTLLKLANNFYALAAIPLPIRNLKFFLTNYPKKIEKNLNTIKDSLTPQSTSYPEQSDDFFRRVFGVFSSDVDYCIRVCDRLIKKSNELQFNFDWSLKAEGHYFPSAISHLIKLLEYFQYDIEEFKNVIIRNFQSDSEEEILENYQYYIDNPEEDIDEGDFFKKIKKLPELITSFNQELLHYISLLKEFITSRARYIHSGKENTPPPSENEETLYHATVNAENIFSKGFTTSPIKTEGIGGSTTIKSGKQGISFTADLYIAKEVARCLKEAIMIANGNINGFNILEWADDKDYILKSVKEIHGQDLNLSDPVDSFNVYRTYLAFGKRYDPFFFGNAENMINVFKTKSPEDVGIIAAKVNMRDPNILYLSGMLEYRVPPEAVISIEKLIR